MTSYATTLLDELALTLHELLEKHAPATIDELAERLHVDRRLAHAAVHHHRMYLSTETCALVHYIVDMTHLYKLTTDQSEIGDWLVRRANDADTRLRTMLAQSDVAVRCTDGRTNEGKRARARAKFLGRLIEDLDELTV